MESTIIVLKQVISMCLMAAISYILVEKNKISPQATKSFSGILLYVVTPCVILSSMQRPFIAEEAWGLGAALLLSLVLQLVFIGLAHLIIPKKNNLNIGVERFAMVMSNTGYIGIPMAQAVLGPDGVFFISANIIVFNLILFSYARLQLLRDGIRHGKLAECCYKLGQLLGGLFGWNVLTLRNLGFQAVELALAFFQLYLRL